MAENLSAVARIRLLIEGAREISNDLERAKEGTLDFDDAVAKSQKRLTGFSRDLKQVAAGLDKAGTTARDTAKTVDKGADEWDAYAKAIQGAQQAQRTFSQQQAMKSIGPAANIPNLPASQMTSAQRKALLSAYDAQNTSVISQAREIEAASQNSLANAARARYALYDVSTTATITAASIAAVGTAAAVAFASVESSFTDVQRTLETADTAVVARLREDLMGLTREIPLAFSDVSQIATLGNQLGITSDQVAGFTETVAKFSAVTGMTAEASAMAFGSLGDLLNVPVEQFENLGSSISYAGRMTRATEEEIVSMTTRLAASATRAGFAADQVVGLSAAFASLRVAPERAQGVMEVYFNRLNTAIAEGGPRLDAFATVAGVSADEVANLVKSDPVGFFERLSVGLGRLDAVSQTRALEQLGLDGIRAGEVFGRVAGNVNTFRSAVAYATKGMAEGSDLARQYALVVDDLASKWQIFLNAVVEAGAAVGEALAPALIVTLDLLTRMLQGLAEFAATPFGQGLLVITGIIAGMTAALAAVIGASALAAASFLAIKTAMADLGLTAAFSAGGVRGLVASIFGIAPAAGAASVALRVLRLALISTGVGALIVALGFLIGLMVDFEGSMISIQAPINFAIDAIFNFVEGVMFAGRALAQFLSRIPLIGGAFKTLASVSDAGIKGVAGLAKSMAHDRWNGYVKGLSKSKEETGDLAAASFDAAGYLEQLGAAGEEGAYELGGFGDAAEEATEKVRTLVDYASDLQGVFSRAFEIRFGPQQGLDTISSGWQKISTAAAEARKEVADYRRTLAGLTADRDIKKYWLSIAEMYGDELRAAKLRTELAETNADISKTQGDLTKAQDKASMSLTGNSEAAIANRSSLLGLVQNYQGYITALASSGMSQGDLKVKSEQLKQEFIRQATQMGYNREEVLKYSTAFDDMALAIGRVPRNVTVTANTNPALQALDEYEARLRSMAGKTYSGGTIEPPKGSVDTIDALGKVQYYAAALDSLSKQRPVPMSALDHASTNLDYWTGRLKALRGYKDGGYTGNVPTNQIAGVTHGKEYVFSAPAVANLGVNNLAFLHALGKSGKGFAPSGLGAAGISRLHPADIDAIGRATAYYQKNPVISRDDVRRGTAGASASDNARGRG